MKNFYTDMIKSLLTQELSKKINFKSNLFFNQGPQAIPLTLDNYKINPKYQDQKLISLNSVYIHIKYPLVSSFNMFDTLMNKAEIKENEKLECFNKILSEITFNSLTFTFWSPRGSLISQPIQGSIQTAESNIKTIIPHLRFNKIQFVEAL
jgi:hypothetical protein